MHFYHGFSVQIIYTKYQLQFFSIQFSKRAGCICTRQKFVYKKMDNQKIYDTQLLDGGKSSWLHTHLDSKLEKASVSTEESFKSSPSPQLPTRKILPKYSFHFGQHFVGEAVQYEVELVQSFKVFRKTINEKYKFKTRYSKLETLHNKAGGVGFPPKKVFGNKNEKFIEERKKLLQQYLNKLCEERNPQILSFVWQIKQIDLELSYEKPFKLPF